MPGTDDHDEQLGPGDEESRDPSVQPDAEQRNAEEGWVPPAPQPGSVPGGGATPAAPFQPGARPAPGAPAPGLSTGAGIGIGSGIGCGAVAIAFVLGVLLAAGQATGSGLTLAIVCAVPLLVGIGLLFSRRTRSVGIGVLIVASAAWIVLIGPCVGVLGF
ncbi:hypothetical protein BCL57_001324 [Agromyces flavus]|uniref:Uncharacterized protein n=1 Tax=Agromyces flavus TaxID=589382 RepID=A0A1H1ZMZ7_9MICO|nr:hypothetical protein [Agromyces flavus]MCP2367170.1 hypothetical protein [Agromyces flavus]GGI46263.1 hypothetical protein GCM10010932_13720 [Agromyces flavus]SDT35023.1 hypothetical protein SAMN04489721_3249 [Agromyces flavus]